MLNQKNRFRLTSVAVAIAMSFTTTVVAAEAKKIAETPEVIVVSGSVLGNSEVADLKTYTVTAPSSPQIK